MQEHRKSKGLPEEREGREFGDDFEEFLKFKKIDEFVLYCHKGSPTDIWLDDWLEKKKQNPQAGSSDEEVPKTQEILNQEHQTQFVQNIDHEANKDSAQSDAFVQPRSPANNSQPGQLNNQMQTNDPHPEHAESQTSLISDSNKSNEEFSKQRPYYTKQKSRASLASLVKASD
jgi:hypothetical protein